MGKLCWFWSQWHKCNPNLPMYKQRCNLWKEKEVLKQGESNIFKCYAFMLSILFIYKKICCYYLSFFTITLFTLTLKTSNLLTKLLFSSEKTRKLKKINKQRGPNKSGGEVVGNLFEKKICRREAFISDLRPLTKFAHIYR